MALPAPLAAFFAAAPDDTAIVDAVFTADAVVHDEGGRHQGRAAIRDWRAEAAAKYGFTAEPLAVTDAGGGTIVACRVSGNVPGSPITLSYGFTLEGERIASLSIPA
ncbi:MAG: nuclear transport factor 2 family protein [Mangrovicoccus sp.]|nr:nuclear transport factor 2 family protein [Mangrovicoccus sp.]